MRWGCREPCLCFAQPWNANPTGRRAKNDAPTPGPLPLERPGPARTRTDEKRLTARAVLATIILALVGLTAYVAATSTPTAQPTTLIYSTLLSDVSTGQVKSVEINQSSGKITGTFTNGKKFAAQGPSGGLPAGDLTLLGSHHVQRSYTASSSSTSIWSTILVWVVPFGVIALLFVWMSRRMQGQLGGMSSWSRSKAKVHVTDRPSTTFEDVAGWGTARRALPPWFGTIDRGPRALAPIGIRADIVSLLHGTVSQE